MGLADLFAKRKAPAPVASPPPAAPHARIFHEDRSKMFDLVQTQLLSELFAVPRDQRKAAWQGAFFHAVWTASLEVAEPPAFLGPDSFVYLRLNLPEPAKAFQSNSLGNLARQAMERMSGAGIFASPTATEPEYVISMGVLDSLLTYDSWLGDPVDLADISRSTRPEDAVGGIQTVTMDKDVQILVGTPNASLLPAHTARALNNHLHERWNIAEPRIAMIMNPATAPARNFVVNRKLSEFASAEVAGRQAGYLLWYLPPRRGIMLMPESWKQEDMHPLSTFFAPAKVEATP